MREMKDSGIDIVKDIPFDWSVIRLKYLCDIQTGNQDTQDADDEGEFNFYVRSPIVERSTRYTFDGEGILMAGDGAGAGRIFHHAFGKYAVHQRVYRLANFKSINSYFLFYYLSNLFNVEMDKGSAQSTVPSVRLPMLLNFGICIPSPDEQNRIADYLESKCNELATLISDIQSQIEVLEEYKRSVITEAVTKGLDPDVEMRDSGIDAFELIPKHWEVMKIKWLLRERNERSVLGEEEPLSMSQKFGIIPTSQMDIIPNMASSFVGAKITHIDDLVFNKLKAHLGVFAVSKYYGLVSPDYAVYFTSGKSIVKYLEFLFKTDNCISEFKRRSTGVGAGLTRLYTSDLFDIKVPIPPISEQMEIAKHLDCKISEINLAISEKQQQIETIEEYKKSLIFEYVTGKKEVQA